MTLSATNWTLSISCLCTIAKVDCTVETALCSAQDVTGYTTLKLFKNGFEKEDGIKYRGSRDAASLEKFIADNLAKSITDEKPATPETSEPVVENGQKFETYKAARNLSDLKGFVNTEKGEVGKPVS